MQPTHGNHKTMTAKPFPTLDLNDGRKIPILGLGCMEFFNDPSLVRDTVYEAIKQGYRHFDTAWIYQTEKLVGEGIKRAIDEGLVKREDIFVTTKIWASNLKHDDLITQAKESNDNLGLQYIDLLIIHSPIPFKKSRVPFPMRADGKPDIHEDLDIHKESWGAMEEVVGLGIAKSIGVSNYHVRHLEKTIANAKIKPAVNQIEGHPYFQQREIYEYCKQHGIIITSYSPFGGPPRKPRPGQSEDFNQSAEANKQSMWQDETINQIAKKHNKTVSQILLKFHVARKVTVIPKTIKKERLIENADIFDFELDDEDLRRLAALERGLSCSPQSFRQVLDSIK